MHFLLTVQIFSDSHEHIINETRVYDYGESSYLLLFRLLLSIIEDPLVTKVFLLQIFLFQLYLLFQYPAVLNHTTEFTISA